MCRNLILTLFELISMKATRLDTVCAWKHIFNALSMRISHYYCLALMLLGQLTRMIQPISNNNMQHINDFHINNNNNNNNNYQSHEFYYRPKIVKRSEANSAVNPYWPSQGREVFLEDYFSSALHDKKEQPAKSKSRLKASTLHLPQYSAAKVVPAAERGGRNGEPNSTEKPVSFDKSKQDDAANFDYVNSMLKDASSLNDLVEHLYTAQARVQLEAQAIRKAQEVASNAQDKLVQTAQQMQEIASSLKNAQQSVADAALSAQTAQLQLAAHDQLLFAARQDVDSISSQIVGMQALESVARSKDASDLTIFLDKQSKGKKRL